MSCNCDMTLCLLSTCPAVPADKSSCKREVLTVEPNSLNRIRLINAGTLVYMTVCFEKHDVTVVALDAAPVEPKTFRECVDVNTGQRWVKGCRGSKVWRGQRDHMLLGVACQL